MEEKTRDHRGFLVRPAFPGKGARIVKPQLSAEREISAGATEAAEVLMGDQRMHFKIGNRKSEIGNRKSGIMNHES